MINQQSGMNWITDTLREAAWAPLSVFLFYLVARSLKLFALWPTIDIPTHFLGGLVIWCAA